MTVYRALANRWRAMREDDSGLALILALLTVLVVGAMLAAVLQYQGTGFTLAPRMQIDRNEANYMQGAVEGAINSIRGSSDAGSLGKPCPSFTAPPAPAGLDGASGKAFTVSCTPLASPAGGGSPDAPDYAIHTLGGAAGEGIFVSGNNSLFVNGPVYSSGVVTVTNQPMNLLRINGSLNAVGTCSGAIRSTDLAGPRCNPPQFTAGDPGYLPGVTDQAGLDTLINSGSDDLRADPVPDCTGSRTVFSPGYYGTRPDLLKARFSACSGKNLWEFTPGAYYFDYVGNWEIKGYQVVGGAVVSGHTAGSALGAACIATAPGVQFIFAGSGTISTQSSSGSVSGLELCAPVSTVAEPQRLAMYGLSGLNTSTTAETAVGPAAVTATTGPTDPTGKWLTPTGARTIDTATAATTIGVLPLFSEDDQARLAYTLPATAVPKGAKVTDVQLRVAHTLLNSSAAVVLDGSRLNSPVTVNVTSASCPSTAPCIFPLLNSLTSSTDDVLWRALRSLNMTYTATADKDKGPKTAPPDLHQATVDGVELRITYTVPTYRQQTCTSGCTFFDSTSNPNVFFHGTVNTPLAGWAVNVHNTGTSIFERGVIVRTISILAGASSKQSAAPFQLPEGSKAGRYVYFIGQIGGQEKLRACVLYTDRAPTTSAGTTAYFGYGVDVKHWLLMRSPSAEGAAC